MDHPPAVPGAPRTPFGLFLAMRYLKPRRTFVSTITLISVLGVTLGIGVMIVVISVMTGFDRELKTKVLGFDPHIQINNGALIDDWRAVRSVAEKTPGVVAVAPFVMGPVLAEFENHRVAPRIRGVDPDLEPRVTDIDALMKNGSGKFDLSGDNAVVGIDLAKTLGLHVGDKLTIYSPRNLEGVAGELKKLQDSELQDSGATKEKIAELREAVLPTEVTVTGIFNSGRYIYDSEFLFVPLYLGQELYELGDSVHGLSVRTVDPYRAQDVKSELLARLDPPLTALTWIDLNAQFFDAVRTERATMFVILFVVLIVAAFCVMNTLITVTVQKTREIGIMKAVGADVGQIVRVFLSQGVVVGVFGLASGLGLGLGILALLNPFKRWMESAFGIEVFSREVYGFGEIPYWTKPEDVVVICAGAFAICALAALIPAYFAARLDPVKALRFE
jgi:lipoprotein-releasing system permease protein